MSNEVFLEPQNVGVALLTYQNVEQTMACLKAIHAQSCFPRRVVLCDNGSDNAVCERIFREWCTLARETEKPTPVEAFGSDTCHAPLVFLRLEENRGVPAGLNAALRLMLYDSGCQAFWVLHNDTLPETFTLAALTHHAGDAPLKPGKDKKNKKNPKGKGPIGMVGSTLLFAEKDVLECSGGGKYSHWRGTVKLIDARHSRSAMTDRADVVREMDFVHTASCLITRALIEKIGLFHEELYKFYEDVEYGMRAQHAGFSLNWAPGAVVRHTAPDGEALAPVMALTEPQIKAPLEDFYYLRNRFYVLKKLYPSHIPWAFFTLFFSRKYFRNRKNQVKHTFQAAMQGVRGKLGEVGVGTHAID